jgi:hypothetical protein
MKTENELPRLSSPRSEKLSALAALVGPELMEKLRQRHPAFGGRTDGNGKTDAGRVAWQRNRLLERLRSNLDAAPAAEPSRQPAPAADKARDGAAASRQRVDRVDTFITSGLNLADLKNEHPAVIARVLRGLDRTARVSVLQQLPGHTARAALRRLRPS